MGDPDAQSLFDGFAEAGDRNLRQGQTLAQVAEHFAVSLSFIEKLQQQRRRESGTLEHIWLIIGRLFLIGLDMLVF
jgi:hypothetical protein